jgi:hypothetical protein
MNDVGHRRERAIAACPVVDRREHRAYMAVLDAQDMVLAVRDLDPREVWGTLAIWADRDLLRLFAVVTALASMVPADRTVRELLEWTEQLGRTPVGAVVRPRDVSHEETLRAAHAAFMRGSRERWVVEGHREYDRDRKRRDRTKVDTEQEVA